MAYNNDGEPQIMDISDINTPRPVRNIRIDSTWKDTINPFLQTHIHTVYVDSRLRVYMVSNERSTFIAKLDTAKIDSAYPDSDVIFRNVWEEVRGRERFLRNGKFRRVSRRVLPSGRVFSVSGRGVYIGDSGGVYVVRVDSGEVMVRLDGIDMGLRVEGEEIVVPGWVKEDGLIRIEVVGGVVSLHHFESEVPVSDPMGLGSKGGVSLIVGRDYIVVVGKGELRIYDAVGRLVKAKRIRGKGKVSVKELPRGVNFIRFKGKVLKFIRR